MAARTEDNFLNRRNTKNAVRSGPGVLAATTLYEDTMAGFSGAYARGLVAADAFAGVVRYQVDNSAGASGDLKAGLERGIEMQLTVAGSSASTTETKVYASDNQTLTITAGSNTLIGITTEQVSGTSWWVHILTAAESAAM